MKRAFMGKPREAQLAELPVCMLDSLFSQVMASRTDKQLTYSLFTLQTVRWAWT